MRHFLLGPFMVSVVNTKANVNKIGGTSFLTRLLSSARAALFPTQSAQAHEPCDIVETAGGGKLPDKWKQQGWEEQAEENAAGEADEENLEPEDPEKDNYQAPPYQSTRAGYSWA